MRVRMWGAGVALGLLIELVTLVTASAASIDITPATVPVGGTVTVRGDVLGPNGQPGCQVPGTVTLISGAFAGQGSFMNQDVETTAGADSKYSVQAKILPGVIPGTYTITGRCGGGNLGVQATLVVTAGMPLTGAGPTQQARTAAYPAGLPLVVAAVTLLALVVLALRRLSWRGGR